MQAHEYNSMQKQLKAALETPDRKPPSDDLPQVVYSEQAIAGAKWEVIFCLWEWSAIAFRNISLETQWLL